MSASLFQVPDGMKLLLHVGSGPKNPELLHPIFRTPQWVERRLDIDPGVCPDVVASMTEMKHVPGGAVDAIWSSHNLEHLYPHEVPVALREFRRVLKADGFALVAVPDLRRLVSAIAADQLTAPLYASPAGPVNALDMIYGFGPALAEGNLFMAHHSGFTPHILDQSLREAGFAHVELYQGTWEVLALARSGTPPPQD